MHGEGLCMNKNYAARTIRSIWNKNYARIRIMHEKFYVGTRIMYGQGLL